MENCLQQTLFISHFDHVLFMFCIHGLIYLSLLKECAFYQKKVMFIRLVFFVLHINSVLANIYLNAL